MKYEDCMYVKEVPKMNQMNTQCIYVREVSKMKYEQCIYVREVAIYVREVFKMKILFMLERYLR